MSDAPDLLALRRQMDDVNRRLVDVLHERAQLARQIGSYKKAHGIEAADPSREQEMLAELLADMPEHGFPTGATQRILEEVFAQSRLLVLAATP